MLSSCLRHFFITRIHVGILVDYNLNIPRYVDTFEEEEPIDIKAVMAEIKELEAQRADLDKQIEVYLKELGIVE